MNPNDDKKSGKGQKRQNDLRFTEMEELTEVEEDSDEERERYLASRHDDESKAAWRKRMRRNK